MVDQDHKDHKDHKDHNHQDPNQRIEALEREVASLQAQLKDQSEAAEAPPQDLEELQVSLPSRRRAITLAVLVGIAALAGILAITLSISSLIEPLSQRAANMIAPWEPGEKKPAKPASKRASPPAKSPEPVPLAPGL
jgi:ferric-dicitrate binding protein FerR (iron transport regulator)